MKLWQQVLIALLLGALTGLVLEDQAINLKIFGTIFILLVKMVIAPLIFFAILSGITSIGSHASLTRVGIKGLSAYLLTSVFAVLIGMSFAAQFKPGVGIDLSMVRDFGGVSEIGILSNSSQAMSFTSFILGLIPVNPLNAMVFDHFLQIIVFSIFAGITINTIGEKGRPLKDLIDSTAQAAFKMIEFIIKLAPIGVFGFISWIVGTQGIEIVSALMKLVITLLAACITQYFVLGFLILIFARLSPLPFYRKILPTQSLAFATSSSKATLSTAMAQLTERMGVSKTNSNFLMPLGVCINMDGTAIYLAICSLFFAQSYGIELNAMNYLILVLTCTIGSIGAAGIPSGSIIFMGMVLNSVGLPVEGIGIILGIDRILDMIRTTINITGDTAITLIVDKSEGMLNEKTYYSK